MEGLTYVPPAFSDFLKSQLIKILVPERDNRRMKKENFTPALISAFTKIEF
jgi:hypothetical protein